MSSIEDKVEKRVTRVHPTSSVCNGRSGSRGANLETVDPNASSYKVTFENALNEPGLVDLLFQGKEPGTENRCL